MYESSFGLTEAPFSISPDPRYLYMSRRHQEAMAHLRYGIQESGGFVQLTGEVGTGKTTICRCMLEQLPENVDVALILNPQIDHNELLAVLCDEIGVSYSPDDSPKRLLDLLNEKLIENFSRGRRTVLVIDEAQMLTREVLEQVRILTNLETTKQKLLQIILIGQPELSNTLSRQDLRQLAQRITARYHLEPLTRDETAEYIRHRLRIAGCHRALFTGSALRRVFRLSNGVPRLINVICDRALLGAYSADSERITAAMVRRAAREVFGASPGGSGVWWWVSGLAVASVLAVAIVRPHWVSTNIPLLEPAAAPAGIDPPGDESSVEPARAAPDTAEEQTPDIDTEVSSMDPEPDPGFAVQMPEEDPRGMSIPELLGSADAARSEQEALVRLLRAWRIDSDDPAGLSCSQVEEVYGLRCLKDQGSWEDLRGFNRVTALVLRHRDNVSYLLLTGLDPDRATFTGTNGVYSFSKSQLQPYWQGRYLLLWRAPPHGAQTIAEHSEGVDVLWLRQTLGRVPSVRPLDLENSRFDRTLKERVMAFQESNNLRVDGVAGMHTIIRLNSIVDPDVPKLEPIQG